MKTTFIYMLKMGLHSIWPLWPLFTLQKKKKLQIWRQAAQGEGGLQALESSSEPFYGGSQPRSNSYASKLEALEELETSISELELLGESDPSVLESELLRRPPTSWKFPHKGETSPLVSILLSPFSKALRVVIIHLLGFPSLGRKTRRREKNDKDGRRRNRIWSHQRGNPSTQCI